MGKLGLSRTIAPLGRQVSINNKILVYNIDNSGFKLLIIKKTSQR